MNNKKRLILILLPLLALLLAGGGFFLYWFLIRKSDNEVSVKYTISKKAISAVGDGDHVTQLTVEYSDVSWNAITWTKSTNLPSGYQWDDFLKIEGLQNETDLGYTQELTISFLDDITPPSDCLSFNFWLVATTKQKEFKSPEINCFFSQRDINALPIQTIDDFEDEPRAYEVAVAFFAINNINPVDDWDLDNWSEVMDCVTVSLTPTGALISIINDNPFFKGQTNITFSYPKGTNVNSVITTTDLGNAFIERPNRQDVRLVVQSLNTVPTGGWDNFWAQCAMSEPNDDVCYVAAFGNDYYGSLSITYGVLN